MELTAHRTLRENHMRARDLFSRGLFAMSTEDPGVKKSLEGLDQTKRDTLNRLVTGSAFVAPIVAAFAMQGISVRPAHAQPGSSSNVT
jgi:hypothetical protein